ncbi:MAG: hypothetical protein NW237_02950 [Cyanobacteriota bacterium]|nr:hypothetical protein [Cyanobacteriota bacterium]
MMDSPDLLGLVNYLGSQVARLEAIETWLAEINARQQEQLAANRDQLMVRRLQKSCTRLDACRRRLQSVSSQVRRGLVAYWRSSPQGQQQMQQPLFLLVQRIEPFLQQYESIFPRQG